MSIPSEFYQSVQLNQPDAVPSMGLITNNGTEQLLRVLPLIKNIDTLDASGKNFRIWERQLKVTVQLVTGLFPVYLDDSSLSNAHHLDRLVLCMIIWCIDAKLQVDVNIDCSAGEVFRALKSNYNTSVGQVGRHPRGPNRSLPHQAALNATHENISCLPELSPEDEFSCVKNDLFGILSRVERQPGSLEAFRKIYSLLDGLTQSANTITAVPTVPHNIITAAQSGSASHRVHQNQPTPQVAPKSHENPSNNASTGLPLTSNIPSEISPEPTSLRSKSGFSNLPVEILDRIASFVEGFAEEERLKKSSVQSQRTKISFLSLPCAAYESSEPQLNSLQAFASLHKELYRICRPRLWEVSFPNLCWRDLPHVI